MIKETENCFTKLDWGRFNIYETRRYKINELFVSINVQKTVQLHISYSNYIEDKLYSAFITNYYTKPVNGQL